MKVPVVTAGNFCFFFCGAGGVAVVLKPLLYIYHKHFRKKPAPLRRRYNTLHSFAEDWDNWDWLKLIRLFEEHVLEIVFPKRGWNWPYKKSRVLYMEKSVVSEFRTPLVRLGLPLSNLASCQESIFGANISELEDGFRMFPIPKHVEQFFLTNSFIIHEKNTMQALILRFNAVHDSLPCLQPFKLHGPTDGYPSHLDSDENGIILAVLERTHPAIHVLCSWGAVVFQNVRSEWKFLHELLNALVANLRHPGCLPLPHRFVYTI